MELVRLGADRGGDHPPRRLRRRRSARAPSGACWRSTPSRWSRSPRSAPATPSWPATSPPATRAARPRIASPTASPAGPSRPSTSAPAPSTAIRSSGCSARSRCTIWRSPRKCRLAVQRQPWRTHLEIEIGRGKKGRRAYGFDDIAIVPSRRTRDPDDIDISWTLGPYRFDMPLRRLGDGRRGQPRHRGARQRARRPRSAQPRGDLDPLRERRGAAGEDRLRAQARGDAAHAGDLRRAGQVGADRASGSRRSRPAAPSSAAR